MIDFLLTGEMHYLIDTARDWLLIFSVAAILLGLGVIKTL